MTALDAALALAAAGSACFFLREDKKPTCPGGFKSATADSTVLRDLHRRYPGPLVGVATGAVSGFDALDIDQKHADAVEWWLAHRDHIPQTRIHRTRGGGLHVLFRHQPALRCWVARPIVGIDGRGDGGYIVWWPAAGLPVLSDDPLGLWPEWLLASVRPAPVPSTAPIASLPECSETYVEAVLRSAIEQVSRAREGIRNATLNAEAYSLARFVAAGQLDGQHVADALAAAAVAAGLAPREIIPTLRSAFRARGVA